MTSIQAIEGLLARGDHETAKSHARAYLAQHPRITEVERETLLGIIRKCDQRFTEDIEQQVAASRREF